MLDVDGASTADGANVLQWYDNGGNNQLWDIDIVNDGGNFCHRSESGNISRSNCWGCQAGQSGWVGGDWVLMHRDDAVEFSCSGGRYYWRRIEIEYWNGSGTINPPLCEVSSGQNILVADTQGNMSGDKCGTCTGCEDYYQQTYYWLDGKVVWTNRERADGANCAYNLGFKLNVSWSEIQQQSSYILRDNGC